MSPWTLHQEAGSRVYTRPLDKLELRFYWDSVFARTADSFQNAVVQIQDDRLLSNDRVSRSLARLKHMYPLLAARTVVKDQKVHFVVDESRLSTDIPDQITRLSYPSGESVKKFIFDSFNSPTGQLTDDLLFRMFIVSRTDDSRIFHVLILIAHSISDGIANTTLARTFLDLISGSAEMMKEPVLEDSLRMSISMEDLSPISKLSLPRQRWRNATANIIAFRRQSKIQGGHTLPRKFTNLTLTTPAHTCSTVSSFTISETETILKACRGYGLTFGNVHPVLGQIAMTRVLCRRRIRGDIDTDEWNWRAKEPMLAAGPINVRPYLDQDWYTHGGYSNVSLAIDFFFYNLPIMPLGKARNLCPGGSMPSFEDLLSTKRFVYRSLLVKKQANVTLKHPLFLEIGNALKPARIERLKGVAKAWQQCRKAAVDSTPLSPSQQVLLGPVVAIGGSSFGDRDPILPLEYPLVRQGAPELRLLSSSTSLHCRPAELYLVAASSGKQLHLGVYWDGNVYDTAVVEEWLSEVKMAINFYLIGVHGRL